ncbi:MAG: Mo-dependent nitrogenase C-terminal domain-containing protein [Cyanobacteria bacterium P01_E01_bin.34]
MRSTLRYSDAQISAWLRGLLTIAWADGHYEPEEQVAIEQIAREQIAPAVDLPNLEPISPEELASQLGTNTDSGENFLRTAVMVALADGVISASEVTMLRRFQTALDLNLNVLDSLDTTAYNLERDEEEMSAMSAQLSTNAPSGANGDRHLEVLAPLKHWLDGMDIHDPRVARFICKMVPAQCPFERDVTVFGKKVIHIPPMCKLNPLYEQLVGLRFRSLSYLADDCGEDVSQYC